MRHDELDTAMDNKRDRPRDRRPNTGTGCDISSRPGNSRACYDRYRAGKLTRPAGACAPDAAAELPDVRPFRFYPERDTLLLGALCRAEVRSHVHSWSIPRPDPDGPLEWCNEHACGR